MSLIVFAISDMDGVHRCVFTPVYFTPVIHGFAAGFDGNQENSLVLSVDDPPEDGLDCPLRLEKLANEVRPVYVFYHFSLSVNLC